jgi:hypothetical protein
MSQKHSAPETLSSVRYSKNTTFRKLDIFPSSGEGRKTLTLLGSLERANLNRWATHIAYLCLSYGYREGLLIEHNIQLQLLVAAT